MFSRPESQFPTPYTFLSADFSNFKSEMIYDSTFQREATHTHTYFVTLLLKFLQRVAKKGGRKKGAEKFLIRGKGKKKRTKRNETNSFSSSSRHLLIVCPIYLWNTSCVASLARAWPLKAGEKPRGKGEREGKGGGKRPVGGYACVVCV